MTTLYRLYDANHRLLYVGVTSSVTARFAQHKASKRWWPQVVQASFMPYFSRAVAEDAEITAIVREHPVYNILDKAFPDSAWKPDPQAGERELVALEVFARPEDVECLAETWLDRTPYLAPVENGS